MNSTNEALMEMIRKAVRKMTEHRQKALNMKPHLYVFDKYIEADTWEEVKQKVTEYLKELYPE